MTWYRIIVVCVGLFAMSNGCAKREADSKGEESNAPDSVIHVSSAAIRSGEIVVEPLATRSLADTLTLSGEIQPNPLSVAHVSTRVAGTIQRVHVVVGDRVGRGRVLATIYSPEFLSLIGDYLLAHERSENAAQSKSPDAPALQEVAQSSKRRLELLGAPATVLAQLHASHQPVNELPILSPASGVVTEVEAGPGKHVDAGTDLFGITDLSRVWAVAHAYERDLGKLRIGQTASIVASAYPGRSFDGRVASLEGAIDEATRTLRVRLNVTNPGLALKPGMFVSARVATGLKREAIVLSEGAIQDLGQQKVAFVATSDTTFIARPVEVRSLGGSLVEVLSGLSPGERVAVVGAFLLKSQALKGELGEE